MKQWLPRTRFQFSVPRLIAYVSVEQIILYFCISKTYWHLTLVRLNQLKTEKCSGRHVKRKTQVSGSCLTCHNKGDSTSQVCSDCSMLPCTARQPATELWLLWNHESCRQLVDLCCREGLVPKQKEKPVLCPVPDCRIISCLFPDNLWGLTCYDIRKLRFLLLECLNENGFVCL